MSTEISFSEIEYDVRKEITVEILPTDKVKGGKISFPNPSTSIWACVGMTLQTIGRIDMFFINGAKDADENFKILNWDQENQVLQVKVREGSRFGG